MLSSYHFFISISTLPVKSRIAFKIIILTYKALHNQAPSNLRYVMYHLIQTEPSTLVFFPVVVFLSPSICTQGAVFS